MKRLFALLIFGAALPAQAMVFSKFHCMYANDGTGWQKFPLSYSSYTNELGQNEIAMGTHAMLVDQATGAGVLGVCSNIWTTVPSEVNMTVRFFHGKELHLDDQVCVFYGKEMTLEKTDKIVETSNDFVAGRATFELKGKKVEIVSILGLAPQPLVSRPEASRHCDEALDATLGESVPWQPAPLKSSFDLILR